MSQLTRNPRQNQMDSSKDWIIEAYIDLLEKSTNPDLITITDIAKKAGVSRQTIYRHFNNKEVILDWYLEKKFILFLSISNKFKNNKDLHRENIKLVFEFCKEESKLIKTLIKLNKEFLLLKKIEIFTNRISNLLFPNKEKLELFYLEKAFSGSLFMVIIGWINNETEDDPSGFSNVIEKLLL